MSLSTDASAKAVFTDPARELIELCDSLRVNTSEKGQIFLADAFDVEQWSLEFHQIVFAIIQRIALVDDLVSSLEIDDDYRNDLRENLAEISKAFTPASMVNAWNARGMTYVGKVNVDPLKAVSGLIRQRVSYRKLSPEEMADVREDVRQLIGWLEEHQLAQSDFIRQAIIDGLGDFLFKLERLQWLGWGYALESLRDVISAYMLLERSGPTKADNPDAVAVLNKVGEGLKSIYKKVGVAKDMTDTADWLLRFYGAAAALKTAAPSIAGFLTQGG